MPRRDDNDDDDDDRYSRPPRPGEDRSRRRYDDDDYDDEDDDYDDRRRRYREPHRGTLILVLGILGLVACGLCAIAAWIMGGQDLEKMRAGTMDREGYSSTQAGYVLGVVGTVLIFIAIIIVMYVFAFVRG